MLDKLKKIAAGLGALLIAVLSFLLWLKDRALRRARLQNIELKNQSELAPLLKDLDDARKKADSAVADYLSDK